MDRISKALEKLDQTDADTAALNSGESAQPQGNANAGHQFHYTQTRSVPVSREVLRQNLVVAGHDPGPFVDAYKVLRTKVLQKMRERGWNALGITSPNALAGKTLTSINLAVSLAMEVNQTVLLVDANLRGPSVHKYFGYEPLFGLNDFLLDNVPIQKILINPKGIERFVILPGKRALFNSSEMLSSPRMAELVDELKKRYPSRIVLFDLPHLATSDALAFAPYVDAVLLVVEEGKTTQDELQHSVEQLQSTPLLGTVLNKVEVDLDSSKA